MTLSNLDSYFFLFLSLCLNAFVIFRLYRYYHNKKFEERVKKMIELDKLNKTEKEELK